MKKYDQTYLKLAHNGSTYLYDEIMDSSVCGCFDCKKTFHPTEIKNWTDVNSEKGKTAMCPYCSNDTVLGKNYPVTDHVFLIEMNQHWCPDDD